MLDPVGSGGEIRGITVVPGITAIFEVVEGDEGKDDSEKSHAYSPHGRHRGCTLQRGLGQLC